ncbi:hypothetical protein EKG37_07340 [Robertmurraya yapensis]|uniref:Uncharacterized protein n=2 Tax=Bacillaceae TaxID=186817 RepID=A0A431WFC8_9BACI|nr:hypothetical protein [Bacillus yapensis]RTR34018.1 hypothetical protein EKG37_07340 [Bacillus yapensis]TKS97336.1 hypothetical protein FAR12_07340 [Bacillus yapensis]
MTKIKRSIFVVSLLFIFAILLIVIWAFNVNVIEGDFDKLTITETGETIKVITNKDEIEHVIELINTSPRSLFLFDTGLKYDYLPHGMFIFEKDREKLEMGFVLTEENELNVLANHWEIEMEHEVLKIK